MIANRGRPQQGLDESNLGRGGRGGGSLNGGGKEGTEHCLQ